METANKTREYTLFDRYVLLQSILQEYGADDTVIAAWFAMYGELIPYCTPQAFDLCLQRSVAIFIATEN